MVPLRPVATVLAALGVAGFMASPAGAEYAPKLSVDINAARPSQTAKFTFVVSQGPKDPGSRRIFIAMPAGFRTSTPLSALTVCDWPAEMMRACPDQSRIGSVEDEAVFPGGTVPLNGPMYWGGQISPGVYKLIVFLDDIGLDLHPQFEAHLTARGGGGLDLSFDDLPRQPSQRFAIYFDGGRRSVVVTPAKCGDYRFDGSFISRGEERASSSATVAIRGCAAAPFAITDLAVKQRAARRRLEFHSNRPGKVRMLLRNAANRTVSDRRVHVRHGDNSIGLPRHLRHGAYRLGLFFKAADGGGNYATKLLFRV